MPGANGRPLTLDHLGALILTAQASAVTPGAARARRGRACALASAIRGNRAGQAAGGARLVLVAAGLAVEAVGEAAHVGEAADAALSGRTRAAAAPHADRARITVCLLAVDTACRQVRALAAKRRKAHARPLWAVVQVSAEQARGGARRRLVGGCRARQARGGRTVGREGAGSTRNRHRRAHAACGARRAGMAATHALWRLEGCCVSKPSRGAGPRSRRSLRAVATQLADARRDGGRLTAHGPCRTEARAERARLLLYLLAVAILAGGACRWVVAVERATLEREGGPPLIVSRPRAVPSQIDIVCERRRQHVHCAAAFCDVDRLELARSEVVVQVSALAQHDAPRRAHPHRATA